VGRLWGRSQDGRSVCVAVVDAVSTCYRKLREGAGARSHDFAADVQNRCDLAWGPGVVQASVVERRTTNGWQPSGHSPEVCRRLQWLRFVCGSPDAKEALRWRVLQEAEKAHGPLVDTVTAESRTPVHLEFLQSLGVRPGAWCRVDVALRAPSARYGTQLFAQAFSRSVKACDEEQGALPALRVLSFDIECYSAARAFPDASLEEDCCICIGLSAETLFSEERNRVDQVLMLGSAELPPDARGCEVLSYSTEQEMLLAFADRVCALDVDVVVGYNQSTFDWAYLHRRLEVLAGLGRLCPDRMLRCQRLSRALTIACPTAKVSISTAALGDNPVCKPRVLGSFEVDLWFYLKRENYNVEALPDLKLNTVAQHFLGEAKHDLPPKDIFDCFDQGPAQRGRIAHYCLQDTRLVLRLVERLEVLPRVLLMARVTGIPPHDVLWRGQQIQVYSQLLLKAHQQDYVVEDAPSAPAGEDGEAAGRFEGATVLPPQSGFYLDPIITVDFASLYPSIMRTYNLCPTTYCPPPASPAPAEAAPAWCLQLPGVGHRFVRSNVHRGLLPQILDELLAQRKTAKRAMSETQDPLRKSLLNSLQLALKISANSVYGFTGATKGFLQCRQVAESTTSAGRHIIEFTRQHLTRSFEGVDVVYGDTDSCFVRLPPARREASVADIFAFGEEMAQEVTRAFAAQLEVTSYVSLEMEKILQPLILYDQKKRYAGWCIEDPKHPGKILARGIELARKDSISATRDCQKAVLKCLLEERDPAKAVELVRAAVTRILELQPGDDFSAIKQSKSLRGSYKNEDSLPHVVVNNLIRRRSSGSESRVGDRVEYVVIASETPRIVDKAEDCAYAREKLLPPDWVHYVEALERPMSRLLGVPLASTQPELAQQLEGFFGQARARAQRQVSSASLARHGTEWLSGHRCKKGTGTQLKLALPGMTTAPRCASPVAPPPPPAAKRRKAEEAPAAGGGMDIRRFLRPAPDSSAGQP
jgi:DNA polymerase delta subunit 1